MQIKSASIELSDWEKNAHTIYVYLNGWKIA